MRRNGIIGICGLFALERAVARLKPKFLISIVDPGVRIETPENISTSRHLHLSMYDVHLPLREPGYPTEAHIRKLLECGARWDARGTLLVHCTAAKSRSPAALMILLAQQNPGAEMRIAQLISRRLPQIAPNPVLIRIADRLLGCQGRLIEAANTVPIPTLNHFEGYASFHAKITLGEPR